MRNHILASFLLVLATNVFGNPVANSPALRLRSMISEKDHELFNEGEGLWFKDDEGRLVRATLDMPMALASANIKMEDHVFFNLYTRDLNGTSETITVDDVDALKKTNFNPSRETKFVTHGWINSKGSPACTLVRDAMLQHGDYNVIVIDWSRITTRPYGWAATHVLDVGKYVAKMVDFLVASGTDVKKITMAGHSLGAHVVGLGSYYAKQKVNYVVGLDPALPLFVLAGPGSRISTDDAKHVEIIHTNAGLLGYMTAIGKADFYPNGGKRQIGCLIDIGGVCSHARSYEYYAESINTKDGFYGKKCADYNSYLKGTCESADDGLMGGPKPYLPFTGNYYLGTQKKHPFAKGKHT